MVVDGKCGFISTKPPFAKIDGRNAKMLIHLNNTHLTNLPKHRLKKDIKSLKYIETLSELLKSNSHSEGGPDPNAILWLYLAIN